MDHPYTNLEWRAFWKTAVATLDTLDIGALSRPKWTINRTDWIATAGSCFAQHISRRLRSNGFSVVDIEPAPSLLEASRHSQYGFGLYSARFGNIYTSTQLRQLILRAFHRFDPIDKVWEKGGAFYDPFRPTIEPNGFDTEQEALESQASHLRAVREMFRKANIFVFTLGLTEMWRSREDGAVYPMCPGIQAGEFDDEKYEFVNLGYEDILEDLNWIVSFLSRRNPQLRFLFTVSPVPLTATASGEHVLVATTYSKSVLRAAVGKFTETNPNVEYFPSYEIITSSAFGGRFFEENLREVRPEGVDFVMKNFFDTMVDASAPGPALKLPESKLKRNRAADVASVVDDELVCDEKIMEFYSK